jgi:hypothetical protein
MQDIARVQAHYTRVKGPLVKSQKERTNQSKTRFHITDRLNHAFLLLSIVGQLAWAATVKVCDGLTTLLSPQPKNQRESRMRSDADLWIAGEKREMETLLSMDTYTIVPLPAGCSELGSMFQYQLKTGSNGETLQHKARLCARGDQQREHEYAETFAPTSRFAVLRMIMAMATQRNLKLKHWDIKGAFLCADIDKDIYLRLPPGYEPAPGMTAKLNRSLYGLRQASSSFHKLLEGWLLEYGFEPVGADRVTFKLDQKGDGKNIIILSLYVDDGLAATNDEALYEQFLDDLRG